ncbi:hypothetical protein COLO4_05045 [Corchorus olitorius]|uniref:Uncharacterized protein n=1 Tax=Corchorus olitorius TaxID=93759 RepID=A0A1R3KS14_9ROSI|nr:hypothetical protein COLO4_05045 [Corchorus olitorius]
MPSPIAKTSSFLKLRLGASEKTSKTKDGLFFNSKSQGISRQGEGKILLKRMGRVFFFFFSVGP